MSDPTQEELEQARQVHGPLVVAAWLGDVAELGLVIDEGADLGDERAQRAMNAALEEGHSKVVELLLDHGYDPNSGHKPALHHVLDVCYRRSVCELLLDRGSELELRCGELGETPLFVAVRRRRLGAVELLADRGADIEARTHSGKTAYGHAVCRPFPEIAAELAARGANTTLTAAEELCVSLLKGDLEDARLRIKGHPELVPSLRAEDARILADLASQGKCEAVALLLDAGADIAARGLDGGTALHASCWFAQPEAARLLIDRGAPLEVACTDHVSTPLHWVAHGSRYSGGAENNVERYVELAELLIERGASFADAADPVRDPHGRRLLQDAVSAVRVVLERHGARED